MSESITQKASRRDGKSRGLLKIFFGSAPGVGKTFSMLNEALRRHARGQKTVVGFAEEDGRKPIDELFQEFELVPPLIVQTIEGSFKTVDVSSIIARKPDLVLIDNLARKNPPGAKNSFRWEDVYELLDAGINVLSTLSVYQLESLNDTIFDITNVRVSETLPDSVLHSADEIEMIDLTPKAILNRLERGDIYPKNEPENVRGQWFEEAKLSALRELTLREAAGRVDEDMEGLRKDKKISKPWAVQDRIMICISPSENSMRLIRRGWRMSNRLHAYAVGVYVEEKRLTPEQVAIIEADVQLAEKLEIKVVKLQGPVVDQLISFARENGITQIIVGHSTRTSLQQRLKSSLVTELARELRTIDILVVAAEKA